MTSPILDRVARSPWLGATVLFVLSAGLLLPGLAELPLMDRDEPRFAQATWEMRERGQWWVPYFNHQYRFDKPPLTYWWMGAHYAWLGRNEFAARLHSAVASWLVALAVNTLGRRLFSPMAGFLAATGWLVMLQVLVHGRLCVADMPMVLGVTMTMLAVSELLLADTAPARFGRWFWMLTVSLAIGFLAKGPVAWAVPALGLMLTRWVWWRKPMPWRRLQPVSALLVATVLVALWGVPALVQTKGAFWEVGIGEHVVKRGTAAFNGRVTVPVVFYLVSAFVSLLPWSQFIPSAFGREPDREPVAARALLLGWFVSPFLIFGFYATQLPHYILPGFPAFALLLFRHGSWPSVSTRGGKQWFIAVAATMSALAVAFGIAAVALPWRGELVVFRWLGLAVACGMLASSVLAPLLIYRVAGRSPTVFTWLSLVAVMLAVSGAFAFGGNLIRSVHPAVMVSHHFRELPPETRHRACEFTEPSLVFYRPPAGISWKMGSDTAKAADWFSPGSSNRAGVFLLREWTAGDALNRWWHHRDFQTPPGRDSTAAVLPRINPEDYQTHVIEGYNVARSSWVELLVVSPRKR